MKKIITLMLLVLATLGAKADAAYDITSFSPYSVDDGEWTSSSLTFTAKKQYGGGQIWRDQDLRAYDKLVVKVTKAEAKFQINLSFKTGEKDGDNDIMHTVSADIPKSDSEQEIVISFTDYKARFCKFELKQMDEFTQDVSIIFKENPVLASNSGDAKVFNLGLANKDLDRGWGSSYANKTITFENGTWKGIGWGFNQYDFNSYEKVVVEFSEAVASGGRIVVEYDEKDGDNSYSSTQNFEAGATSVGVTLNSTYSNKVNQIYLQNYTASAVFKLKRAYVADDNYFVLDEKVTPYLNTANNSYVDLTRTLKVGWNTICLPFELTSDQVTTYFGSGAKVYEYTSSDASAVTVTQVSEMTAGKPYLLKMDEAKNSITFTGVNVTATTPDASTVFKGNFTAAMNMQDKYGVTGNVIKKGASGATLKAFAGYFDFGSGAPAFFDINDGQATGISTIDLDAKHADDTECFYNLAGQRVNQPARGIFVKNGKKYIIK